MREKLIEVMKDTRANAAWHRWGYEESADYLIENDVVHVVRCKNCKHWLKDVPGCTEFVGRCEWARYMVGAAGYCVYGERRTDNG